MIVLAAATTAFAVRRVASHARDALPPGTAVSRIRAPRRSTPREASRQPIRRVFGSVVFRAREEVTMPKPGDTAVARLQVQLRDTVWDALYAPVIRLIEATAERLNGCSS